MSRLLTRAFKRDMHSLHIELHRHRKFQIVVTVGVLTTSALAYALPHHSELIVMGSAATNLLWLWE